MAQGEKLAAYAQTEPNAGSDVGSIRTRAVLEGSHYVLNGTKMFISNSHEADIFVVLARFSDEPGTRGVGAIVVEKETAGFSVSKKDHKLGFKGTSISEVVFEDVRVPAGNLLVDAGEFRKMMEAFNSERCGNAALSLGVAQGAFDEARRYCEERSQFGKPLSSFQGLRWMLADMAIQIEAGRLLLYRAATNAEEALPNLMETSMAKAFCNDMGIEVQGASDTWRIRVHAGVSGRKDVPRRSLSSSWRRHGTNTKEPDRR
jgi:butyryl-CoA dehydrogenase